MAAAAMTDSRRWEVIAELHAPPVTAHVPVLAVTADTTAPADELRATGF